MQNNSLTPIILYEDDHIIAVNKPAGILAQDDSTGRPSLAAMVKGRLASRLPGGESPFCAALHRLDRPVSGVMLFAKNPVAAGRLSGDIRERKVRKFYCAVVLHSPGTVIPGEWTELDQHYIRRRDRAYIVDAGTPGALDVSLRYRTMEISSAHASVLVELITGRRHQVRVQLASLGMPVMGDWFYGSKEMLADDVICLHARFTSFSHPVTGLPLNVEAPLPAYMAERIGTIPEPADCLK